MSNKYKKVVIKEGLVEITGDYKKAIILNQFLYWSERVKNFDRFLEEEDHRTDTSEKISKRHGWIFKSSKELAEETMLGFSCSTMRKHIKCLIDKGFLEERDNPNYKWDKTKQYRVNTRKVRVELEKRGYPLENYKLLNKLKDPFSEPNTRTSESGTREVESRKAIPETTTETTTDTTYPSANAESKNLSFTEAQEEVLTVLSEKKYFNEVNAIIKQETNLWALVGRFLKTNFFTKNGDGLQFRQDRQHYFDSLLENLRAIKKMPGFQDPESIDDWFPYLTLILQQYAGLSKPWEERKAREELKEKIEKTKREEKKYKDKIKVFGKRMEKKKENGADEISIQAEQDDIDYYKDAIEQQKEKRKELKAQL